MPIGIFAKQMDIRQSNDSIFRKWKVKIPIPVHTSIMLFYSYVLSKQSTAQLSHMTGYSEPIFWDSEIHGGIFREDLSRAKHVAASLSIYREATFIIGIWSPRLVHLFFTCHKRLKKKTGGKRTMGPIRAL